MKHHNIILLSYTSIIIIQNNLIHIFYKMVTYNLQHITYLLTHQTLEILSDLKTFLHTTNLFFCPNYTFIYNQPAFEQFWCACDTAATINTAPLSYAGYLFCIWTHNYIMAILMETKQRSNFCCVLNVLFNSTLALKANTALGMDESLRRLEYLHFK